MSPRRTSRSDDLSRLESEGYALELRGGYLLMHDVPYVTSTRQVARGTLVSSLAMSGDRTAYNGDHVAYFVGDVPCDAQGQRLEQMLNSQADQPLMPGLVVNMLFSSKPAAGYTDYHHKMSTYASLISGPAQALDPSATARTFPVLGADEEDDSPFAYIDTATSRAGIGVAADKLRVGRVAIVGLGGTGAYILDALAKMPIREIHLFDADLFLQHNAFRAPGAASREELERKPLKVQRLVEMYGRMHRGIHPHPYAIDETNVVELADMDHVMLAIDDGPARRTIIDALDATVTSYIDVGMGIWLADDRLGGLVRVTTATASRREGRENVPFGGGGAEDLYAQNVQIAELNMLNAALAVIRLKKLLGFYADYEQELQATYDIDGNRLHNAQALQL